MRLISKFLHFIGVLDLKPTTVVTSVSEEATPRSCRATPNQATQVYKRETPSERRRRLERARWNGGSNG